MENEDYFLQWRPEMECRKTCREYLDNPKGYEIYQLWYEYLKENEAYKAFCNQTDKDSDSPLYEVFDAWGDIHTTPWEDTIKRVCDQIQDYIYFSDDISKVWEYSQLETFNSCVKSYKEKFKRNPRIKELEKFFAMEENPKWDRENIFLKVDISSPIEVLMRQFKAIVLEKRKSRELSDKTIEQYAPFPKPSRTLNDKDIECLGRYLKVYQLSEKQGLGLDNVIDTLDPKGIIHPGIRYVDAWRKEKDNAKDIIENVAINIFPGKYGDALKRGKESKTKK